MALVLQNHDIDSAGQNAADSLQLLWSTQGRAQIDGDDLLCAQLAHYAGGKIINQASIGEHVAIALNRSEDAGDRHRGAQGLGERTVFENDFSPVLHIGGDAAERNGKVVKAGNRRIRKRNAVEQQSYALRGVDAVWGA